MRVILIGLGGIGSNLAEPLAQLMSFAKSERGTNRLVLIDGDRFELKNRNRQKFDEIGNKAEVTAKRLRDLFPDLDIQAKPHFVDADNLYLFVKEGDVVLLCVDNHATRKVVNEHLATLKNALLISGGNEIYDGNVQVYLRRDGLDASPSLFYRHPEIEFPKDKNPAEPGCEEAIDQGVIQLLPVNRIISDMMLNAYFLWLELGTVRYREVFFDLRTGNTRAVL